MEDWLARLRPFQEVVSTADLTLDIVEFQHMLECELDPLLQGDWQSRCRHIVKLRRAFEMADIDGDLTIGREELEIVLLASDASNEHSVADIDRLWAILNPENKAVIGFLEFLHGVAALHRSATATNDLKLADMMKFDEPNRWALLSLLIDTPVDPHTEENLLLGLNPVERTGIKYLRHMQQVHLPTARWFT
eukprot:SAG31_NODE_4365_length_3307_cov_10.960723_2_plen_192_part_00